MPTMAEAAREAAKRAGERERQQKERREYRERERKQRQRDSRSRARYSTKQSGEKQRQRVEAAEQIDLNKARIRSEAKEHERSTRIASENQIKRSARIRGAAAAPFQPTQTVSAPSIISPILLIIFTWAGIVILYAMITSPNTSSGFFNSMREWVGLLYQTKPMFTTEQVSG